MIGGCLGRRPTLACLYLGGSGGMPPREILKMFSPRDAFSLMLGTKSRAVKTDFYQVMMKK